MADTFSRGGIPGQQGGATTQQRGAAGGATASQEGGVMESIRDVASNVTSRVGDALDTARQGVSDAASTAFRSAGDAFDSVSGFMSRYPVATFFCGVGLGFLLACAMNKMSSTTERGNY
jgi:hypothetical protein